MDVGIYMVIIMGFFLGITWLLRFFLTQKISRKVNGEQQNVGGSNT